MELDHPLVSTSRPRPAAPVDPERLAYESPKAMIKLIAKNILIDHLRKRKSRGGGLDDGSLEVAEDQSYDANPEALVFVAEALLEPVLTGPQAKQAAKQRPLSVEDAARLFGRDVTRMQPKQLARELDER